MHVVLADGDDQAEIGLDHPLLGVLIIVVYDPPAEMLLLFGGQQGNFIDLSQVKLQIGLHT